MTDYSLVSTVKNRDAQLDAELAELEKKPDTNPDEEVIEKSSGDNTNWSKRYSDLRSYADKQINDLKKQLAEKDKAIAENKKTELPATEEEFEAWLQKFPDVARMIETLIVKKSPGVPQEIVREIETLKEDRYALARERALDDLLKIHNDFFDIRETEDFKNWFEEKRLSRSKIDQQIYSAVYEQDTDGLEAARAITEYKNAKGLIKKTKDKLEDAAFVPQGRSSQTRPNAEDTNKAYKFSLSQIEKMNIREYEKLEAEIDQARREGKILDDLGAAF